MPQMSAVQALLSSQLFGQFGLRLQLTTPALQVPLNVHCKETKLTCWQMVAEQESAVQLLLSLQSALEVQPPGGISGAMHAPIALQVYPLQPPPNIQVKFEHDAPTLGLAS